MVKPLGPTVGPTVGSMVGLMVGSTVGPMVGPTVGLTVFVSAVCFTKLNKYHQLKRVTEFAQTRNVFK